MAIKYVHARKPGGQLIHLVDADGLIHDLRFGESSEFLIGHARCLCGKGGKGWIVSRSDEGERCRECWARR